MKKLMLGFLITGCFVFYSSGSAQRATLTVPVRQLLAAPDHYNGKKISTTGYYASDGHSAVLCADAAAAHGTDARSRIFLDFEHSSLSQPRLTSVHYGYVDLTGTFHYRKFDTKTGPRGERVVTVGFGWMNSYEKQITKLTAFRNVVTPSQ